MFHCHHNISVSDNTQCEKLFYFISGCWCLLRWWYRYSERS